MDADANANANAKANANIRGSTIALRELSSGELIIIKNTLKIEDKLSDVPKKKLE